MSPTIGLLVCDHVGAELREASGGRDYPEIYEDFLLGSGSPLDVKVYDAVGGELPADPSEADGWLITGSRHDAFGSEPWLAALREYVRELEAKEARTVGICFGHQVVAAALGGAVERAGGWKVGPQNLAVEATPWFGGADVCIHAMHRDEVTELPEGAVPIGRGTTAEYPMYLVGDTILCVQDHPEFDDGYTSALVAMRRERLGAELAEAALERIGSVPTDGERVSRWLVDFLLDLRSGAPR